VPLLPDVVTKTKAALADKGEFKDGVFFPKDGQPQDGYEALAAEALGHAVEYPPSLLKTPITVQTKELPWTPYSDGVEVKRIAGLFGTGPFVTLVRMKKGATLPAGNVGWQQARYVVEGTIRWQDEDYDGISMFYYPPSIDYPATVAEADDTILFVIQWSTNLDAQPEVPGGSVL